MLYSGLSQIQQSLENDTLCPTRISVSTIKQLVHYLLKCPQLVEITYYPLGFHKIKLFHGTKYKINLQLYDEDRNTIDTFPHFHGFKFFSLPTQYGIKEVIYEFNRVLTPLPQEEVMENFIKATDKIGYNNSGIIYLLNSILKDIKSGLNSGGEYASYRSLFEGVPPTYEELSTFGLQYNINENNSPYKGGSGYLREIGRRNNPSGRWYKAMEDNAHIATIQGGELSIIVKEVKRSTQHPGGPIKTLFTQSDDLIQQKKIPITGEKNKIALLLKVLNKLNLIPYENSHLNNVSTKNSCN